MDNDERYSRQRDIIPADRLAACQATVIGLAPSAGKWLCNLRLWACPGYSLWILTWSSPATWPAKDSWKRTWAG